MKYKLLFVLSLFINLWATNQLEQSFLSPLVNDSNWQLLETYDDGVRLYSKKIETYNLNAYRVEKPTTAKKDALMQVFEKVENYDQILTSAGNITFDTIEKTEEKALAYQHIDIPIINNRHYFYHMYKSNDNQDYAFWQLTEVDRSLVSEVIKKHNLDQEPVKLKTGAGIYQVKETGNQTIAQYSLFLDPEGNIPSFLANMANKNGLVNMFRDLLKYTE